MAFTPDGIAFPYMAVHSQVHSTMRCRSVIGGFERITIG